MVLPPEAGGFQPRCTFFELLGMDSNDLKLAIECSPYSSESVEYAAFLRWLVSG